ncbi:MAG: hypothetical protein ACRELC_09990 [Gemmatimonadota bacterium]
MRRTFLAMLTPLIGAGLIAAGSVRPAYETLDADAEPLKSAFNADASKVRIFMYVSPTCGGCLRGARDIQKHVLDDVDASNLAVYVVWAPKNGARERHVEKATGLVQDARATQYWDEEGAIVRSLDAALRLTGPCAGAFMIYGPAARWEGQDPPQPAYWEDAHVIDLGRDVAPSFDAETFGTKVVELLR